MHNQHWQFKATEDSKSKGNDITILSFKISCARSRSTTFSRISVGKPRRLSGGLPAVIQAGDLRAWSAFADRRSVLMLCVKVVVSVKS